MVSAASSPDLTPFVSPQIHTLPDELLACIFLLTTDATTIASSQVCRRWREVALGYPLLWARILDFELDSAEWSEELLRRSQDLPIDIGDKLIPSLPLHLGRALAQSHRWRTFSIKLTVVDDALVPVLSRPAPHLEFFCLHVHRPIELILPPSLFADDAPNLRAICLSQCGFNPDNISIFGNLTTISVIGTNRGDTPQRPNVAQWLHVLNAAPLLKNLQIEQAVAQSAAAETLLQVNLPNLSRMHLSGSTTVCGQLLGHLNAPSLFQLMVCCSVSRQTESFKAIIQFVETRFGWGRPDFENVGCCITLGNSTFQMRHEPPESDTTSPYLDMRLDATNVTNTYILENIMLLFVYPLLTELDPLMLQTTRLTLFHPNNIPSNGPPARLGTVNSATIVLALFPKVHTFKISGEIQILVFILLCKTAPTYLDNKLYCLLPSLRKLELDMMDVKNSSKDSRGQSLFDVFVGVLQDRIKKGYSVEAVEFGDECPCSTQQVDMLKDLGIEVAFK